MQDILAISIASIAGAYLLRQAWLRFARKSGTACGSCPSCGTNDSVKSRPLVNISLDAPHRAK